MWWTQFILNCSANNPQTQFLPNILQTKPSTVCSCLTTVYGGHDSLQPQNETISSLWKYIAGLWCKTQCPLLTYLEKLEEKIPDRT